MKLSDKLALAALCMLVVTAVTIVVGTVVQSPRLCISSIGFMLLAGAFFSEALVYMSEGR